MLLDRIEAIREAKIVLASSSPRRTEILNNILGLNASIVPSTFPEDLDKSKFTPKEYVEENAKLKALEVWERLLSEPIVAAHATRYNFPSLIVGADTVVVHDATILEKPKSVEAAKAMLHSLSGRTHEVCTGVALVYAPMEDDGEPHVVTFVETTTVHFAELSAGNIDAYVASGEPMDKAGGYGIQARGGAFVSGISGCYYNVMGFPMHRFCATLDCDRLEAWVGQHERHGARCEGPSRSHEELESLGTVVH